VPAGGARALRFECGGCGATFYDTFVTRLERNYCDSAKGLAAASQPDESNLIPIAPAGEGPDPRPFFVILAQDNGVLGDQKQGEELKCWACKWAKPCPAYQPGSGQDCSGVTGPSAEPNLPDSAHPASWSRRSARSHARMRL
jgi:hypothetical protein